ncbi:fibronectin type III domain protein, partial [Ancylostoma caninum]
WIPTKRAPPRYPQVSYVIEIRELPEKEWTLLDYNIPEPVCKVRNLELGKSYQFRVRAENIYGISDPSPASPPSRLMAPPQPVLDKKTKKVIPLLDPYAEKALDLAHAEQYGEYACAPWFAPGVIEKRYCAENDVLTITLNVAGYPDPEIKWKFRATVNPGLPTPPDRGPFIKEVTGHYLTLSWIPTKRAPPRYPQVSYVIEIRELPEKEWTLLDYNIPEPVCKVRNLELGKSYQFRVRAENIYGISDPSPASPPSRLMAPPQPVLDKKTKKVIPLLDPYAEKALDLAHAEQYACAPWFAPGVIEKRYCAENDVLTITLNVAGYPDPEIKWKFRGWDIDTTSPMSKCKVFTIGGTETTLMISSFSKDNVGQYQCFATNPYGEAQQNIMVDLAIRPNFIQPLYNRTFSDAQPMRLDVRVEGQPFPELKWLKEWRPIVESTRVKFVQEGPYLCSLIVTDPMWRDS